MPPRTQSRTVNLNTVLAILTMIGMVFGAGRYLLPLAVLPEKVAAVDQSLKEVRGNVDELAKVQAVQTDVLRRMAEIAEQSQAMRREVDVTRTELAEVKRRMEKVEER